MTGDILVLNSGSSSIKFAVYHDDCDVALVCRGIVEGIGGRGRLLVYSSAGEQVANLTAPSTPLQHCRALEMVLEHLQMTGDASGLAAVGHRVVHGGVMHTAPTLVDQTVLENLTGLVPLAPLHQPPNLAGIRALLAIRPELPQVACFDTAFHCAHEPKVYAYALPHEISQTGVRRYGFHGLSYEYIASRLGDVAGLEADADSKVVMAHLGNGASLCALRAGQSIDTTMGFTALDGLPMGSRCGSLDPGVILHLLSEKDMSVEAVTDMLYHRSGLLGMSGVSNDMRVLLSDGGERARAAIDVFVYRVSREIGAMMTALEGMDALVFTGGIGEHAAPIRARVCDAFRWMGLRLEPDANTKANGCARITASDSAISAYVIPTNEELVVARHTREVLASYL